jgi:hypothetical protein
VSGDYGANAAGLDAYGEVSSASGGNGSFTPFNGDLTWKNSLSAIQGAKYFQVRVSFVSNAETLLTPSLSALGFAFRK